MPAWEDRQAVAFDRPLAASDLVAELEVDRGPILAQAAGLYDGRVVVQTQSYGPEARGGAAKSEVCISDAPINNLKPRRGLRATRRVNPTSYLRAISKMKTRDSLRAKYHMKPI